MNTDAYNTLFSEFPALRGEHILIHQMLETDVDALREMTENANVYRYIQPFLYRKSRGNLLAAIRNLNGRDFEKKKCVIAGIYPLDEPERLIGLAEMFDYKKRTDRITIGYRINETYWHQGFATEAVRLMVGYLSHEIGVSELVAYVMPENRYSARVLLKNGFIPRGREKAAVPWGGQEAAVLDVYSYTGANAGRGDEA